MVLVVLLAIFCYSSYKLAEGLITAKKERDAFSELSQIVAGSSPSPGPEMTENELLASEINAANSADNPDDESSGKPKERSLLQQYIPLYEMNPDFFGWLSIEGTEIDYPVMYSPDRPEYYISRAFDGSYSSSGVPFVDGKCPADGNYYLIYGHHMRNRSMFGSLPKYADQSYYEGHPVIRFATLYEQREYHVIAAFYSRVYGEKEAGVFRYYEYTDLTDEAVFEEYLEQVRAAAIYDTGFTAEYGDELLTLSTCNYHTQDGRFVVVAKRIDAVD